MHNENQAKNNEKQRGTSELMTEITKLREEIAVLIKKCDENDKISSQISQDIKDVKANLADTAERLTRINERMDVYSAMNN